MGQFDPANFLDATTTEAGSTTFTPVPEGEYTAVITGDPEIRQWTGKKDPTKSGLAADVTWSIDDPSVKQLLERDTVTVKQGIMLDLTDAGGLDMAKGRNVQLNRLREAVGLNKPGEPFSFRMLSGKVAKIQVKHRVEGEQVYAEVKAVAPL